MKQRTYQELGIKWFYWFIVVFWWALSACALWVGVNGDSAEDRRAGMTAGIMFSGISICALLWPILRKREPEGVAVETIRTPELCCEAILIPASRVKRIIFLVGAFFMGSGVLALLFQTDNLEHLFKGVIAAIFYIVIVSLGIRDCFLPRLGIVLLPKGLLWREMFRTSCMIPWDVITEVVIFPKKEQYSKSRCLGIIVHDPGFVETSKGRQKKLAENRARYGVHFDFSTETLLLSLDLAASTIEFYRRDPGSRREIGTATALQRIENLKSRLEGTYNSLGVSTGAR